MRMDFFELQQQMHRQKQEEIETPARGITLIM